MTAASASRPAQRMKREQILRFRIARHGLGRRRRLTPAEAAACPASDFSRDSALLALAARSEELVLVDGAIAGLWKVRARGTKSSFEVEELGRVPRRKLGDEVERVAGLRGSAGVELSWA